MKSWQYGLLALGVLVCSIRPVDLLILEGSILGEKTTGIGVITWVIGIGILGLFVITMPLGKSRTRSL